MPKGSVITSGPRRLIVGRLLGVGGLSRVYAAYYDELDSPEVAVKSSVVGEWSDEGTVACRASLLWEGEVLSELTHPGIVHLFSFGLAKEGLAREFPFLIMELLNGESLAKRSREAGGLRAEAAVSFVLAIGDILRYLHYEAQRTPGDLKTENIFIMPDGTLKIFDLAASVRIGGHSTCSGEFFGLGTRILWGSPPYTAPEQEDKAAVITGAADVYALALVLGQLMAPGYYGRGNEHLVRAHPVAPDLPENVQLVIDLMTTRNPAERVERETALRRVSALR